MLLGGCSSLTTFCFHCCIVHVLVFDLSADSVSKYADMQGSGSRSYSLPVAHNDLSRSVHLLSNLLEDEQLNI